MGTIYCYSTGGRPGFIEGAAIHEDGRLLATNISTNLQFLKYDLGVTSNQKHDIYNALCGEGKWCVEWVADVSSHPGLAAALALRGVTVPVPRKVNIEYMDVHHPQYREYGERACDIVVAWNAGYVTLEVMPIHNQPGSYCVSFPDKNNMSLMVHVQVMYTTPDTWQVLRMMREHL